MITFHKYHVLICIDTDDIVHYIQKHGSCITTNEQQSP